MKHTHITIRIRTGISGRVSKKIGFYAKYSLQIEIFFIIKYEIKILPENSTNQ